MPTTSVPFSPYFCFKSTESFVFFLSINKYINYIYLIDLCWVRAGKAVQVLIEMEDVWSFSPCLAQWEAHPGNECGRGSVSPSHVFYGAMGPSLPRTEWDNQCWKEPRVQAISQLKATEWLLIRCFGEEAAGEGGAEPEQPDANRALVQPVCAAITVAGR